MSVQVIGDLLNFSPPTNTLVTGATFITSNGIGIGTYSPLQSFHLQGNAYTSGSIGIGSTQPMQALDVVGTALVSTSIGIGTKTPLLPLHIQGNAYISGNIGVGSTQPIASLDVSGTIRGTNLTIANAVTTSNLTVLGTQTIIDTYTTYSSNLVIDNQIGTGPALLVLQKGVGSQYPVADFYDRDISTTVPALRIADGANVGIGTATPLQLLHVQGTTYVSGSIGIGSTQPIQSLDVVGSALVSTNVGIGTKIALAPLHVQGNAIITGSSIGLGITNPLAPIHFQGLTYHSSNIGIGTTIMRSILHADITGTSGQYSTVASLINRAGGAGTGVGIDFSTYSITNTQDPSARLAVTDNNYSGDFVFSTKNFGAATNTLVERVRINNAGSIGIGTNYPKRELHITASFPTIYLDASTVELPILMNDNSYLRLGADVTYKPHILVVGLNFTSAPGRVQMKYNTYLTFDTVNGVSSTEQIRFDVNGNVGIGTALPLRPLHVQGNANITSTLSITGQISSTVATGTAPLSVASTTLVTNLNAGLLNSQNGAYYLDFTNFTNRVHICRIGTNFTNATTAVVTFTSYAMSTNMVTSFTLDFLWNQSATTPVSNMLIANLTGTATFIAASLRTYYGADLVYEVPFTVLNAGNLNLLGTTPSTTAYYTTSLVGWMQNASGANASIDFRARSGATTSTLTISSWCLNVYRDVGDTGF